MKVLYAILLGIIQGLTEFLPISSSGHLILFESIFGINSGTLFFNVLLHLATLTAVIIVFWKDICILIKNPISKDMKILLVSTIPTVIIALIVEKCIDEFKLLIFLGFGFLISSLLLTITSILQNKKSKNSIKEIGYKQGLIVGFVQGLAVLPGISRSGSTICAGLLQGIDREESAKFSFLLSIPVIIGGMLFEVVDGVKSGFGQVSFLPCVLGFIFAFVVSLLTIKFMMRIVKKGRWWIFAIYLFILSIIVILNQFVFSWL